MQSSFSYKILICFLGCFFIFFSHHSLMAQTSSLDTVDRVYSQKKLIIVAGGETVFYGGMLVGLSKIWYAGTKKEPFHLVNDNKDWLQIDKFGHAFTCYALGKTSINLLRWSGVAEKKAIWYGGFFGTLFMTSVEVLDGHYPFGFSPMDIVANFTGGALAVFQELAFREQVMTAKFSFRTSDLQQYDPNGLGSNYIESLVQDYNGQKFWLSFNPYSIMKKENKIPKWLNLAVGYSAYGMFSSRKNPVYKGGIKLPEIERYRRFYLSPDINFEKISTNSKMLKRLFYLLNHIKFPLPTIEVNSNGKWIFHPVYF